MDFAILAEPIKFKGKWKTWQIRGYWRGNEKETDKRHFNMKVKVKVKEMPMLNPKEQEKRLRESEI